MESQKSRSRMACVAQIRIDLTLLASWPLVAAVESTRVLGGSVSNEVLNRSTFPGNPALEERLASNNFRRGSALSMC